MALEGWPSGRRRTTGNRVGLTALQGSNPCPSAIFFLAACALLVLAFAPAQYFGRQEDDLIFFVGARALLSGRYCLLTSPGCPAITLMNPGWPLLLTPLAAVTEKPVYFQLYAALLLACTPVFVWFWLRRRSDEWTGLFAAGLFASSPFVLSQSGSVMSEIPFVLLMIGSLFASEAGRPGVVGAASSLLLLTRTAGISLIPGVVAPFLKKRNLRQAALALIPPLATFAAWTAWTWSKSRSLGKLDLGPAFHFDAVGRNGLFYASELGGSFLPPQAQGLAVPLGAVLLAVAAYGVFLALKRRRDDPAALAALGTSLMLAFWGWQYERYLLAALPLILWALVSGLGVRAKPALATLLVLQLVTQALPRLFKPSPWAQPALGRTYAWLSAQPTPALLASTQSVRDGWYAGMPSTNLPVAETSSEFAAALKKMRVSYTLRVDGQDYGLDADPQAPIRRRVEKTYSFLEDAARFRKVHEEPAERAAVYVPL